MKIEYLKLYNFKRFALNSIKSFTYTPELKTQLILGTNGSGKSSLLNELSPLPARSKDFYDGGYKEIHISHNNHKYKLCNHYNNKHSFIKDDEELNTGGTLSVQKALVFQEFRLNDKLHEILTGKINFCDMSVSDRRKWFTELSNNDYNYILSVYDKIKEKYNTLNTELKITRQLIVQEELKIIDDEQIENVKNRLSELDSLIKKLSTLKTHVDFDERNLINQLNVIQNELTVSTDKILHLRQNINYHYIHYNPISNYNDRKTELSSILYHSQQELNSKIQNYTTLENQLKELESQKSYDEILKELENIGEQQRLLENEYCSLENIETIYKHFLSIKDTLVNILIELESNSDLRYSKENYKVIQDKLELLNTSLNNKSVLESKLRRIIYDQENSLKNHQVECPNCSHKWIPGYNIEIYESTKSELENLLESIKKDNEEKDRLIEYKNNLIDYFNKYKMLLDIFKSYENLNFIYDSLKIDIQNNPSLAVNKIHFLESQIKQAYEFYNLEVSKKELKQLIENKEKDLDTIKTKIIEDLKKYELEIKLLTEQENNYKKELDLLNKQIQNYESINKGIIYIEDKLKNYNSLSKDYLTLKINEGINHIINPLLSETIELQNKLSSIHSQKSYVESLKNKVLELEKDYNASKILMEVLSPKTGIIAESLINFINDIIAYITDLVNEVWTYRIEIVPIEIDNENDSLDYRFSLKVDNNDPIEDISKGSNGIKEIINLAFKICVLFYLDFKGYPLYLDEFGSSFDSQHRLNANKIIHKLINDDNFSNIFMISHYEESYGSLNNTDIIVLDSSNINLTTKNFNTVAVIE